MDDRQLLGGLEPRDWDRLAGDRFYSTSAWLRFCAADYGPGGGAAVSRVAGAVESAVCTAEISSLSSWSRYNWNSMLDRAGLPLLPKTGMMIGPREGFNTRLLGAAGDHDPAAAQRLLAEIRQQHGGDPDRACVAMYLTSADARALLGAGVAAEPVLLDVDAWIEVPPGGWPEYLDRLPRKRRVSAIREERAYCDAGYRTKYETLATCWEEAAGPAAATLRKYGHDSDPAEEAVSLRRHVECMGEAARVTLCSLGDGPLLGFCLHYGFGDTIHVRWAGFDYDRLVGAAEYFNVVYYAQIRLAAAQGRRWLQMGVTMSETKALRGARLRPVWLLDLAEHGALAGAREQIRAYNRRAYTELAENPRTRGAVSAEDFEMGYAPSA